MIRIVLKRCNDAKVTRLPDSRIARTLYTNAVLTGRNERRRGQFQGLLFQHPVIALLETFIPVRTDSVCTLQVEVKDRRLMCSPCVYVHIPGRFGTPHHAFGVPSRKTPRLAIRTDILASLSGQDDRSVHNKRSHVVGY